MKNLAMSVCALILLASVFSHAGEIKKPKMATTWRVFHNFLEDQMILIEVPQVPGPSQGLAVLDMHIFLGSGIQNLPLKEVQILSAKVSDSGPGVLQINGMGAILLPGEIYRQSVEVVLDGNRKLTIPMAADAGQKATLHFDDRAPIELDLMKVTQPDLDMISLATNSSKFSIGIPSVACRVMFR